jgi:hypothetical protein
MQFHSLFNHFSKFMTVVLKFTKVEQDKSHANVQETRERELTHFIQGDSRHYVKPNTVVELSPSRAHSKHKEMISFQDLQYP